MSGWGCAQSADRMEADVSGDGAVGQKIALCALVFFGAVQHCIISAGFHSR